MPKDLASHLLRKHVGRTRDDLPRCGDCGRTPLTGELLHVIEDERVLCTLCLGHVSEVERHAAVSRRVHATAKPLAVVRHAA